MWHDFWTSIVEGVGFGIGGTIVYAVAARFSRRKP